MEVKSKKVDMKKIAILANKSSGQGSALKATLSAREKLWGYPHEIHFPSSQSELRTICSKLSPEIYEALIVIGGDGTVHQAIRGFAIQPNDVPLYPFPGGTANDLARELGLHADWHQVETLIGQKQHDLIDMIEVNGIPFSTVGGIGICAILTQEFNDIRSRSPLFKKLSQLLHIQIYTALSAKTILTRRDYLHYIHIQSSDFNEKIRTPAVFFCNQTYLGGNVKVAPTLDNTDKRFNVLIVTNTSRARLLTSSLQLKRGKLPSNFFVFSTDHLTLTDLNNRKLSVFGDGELLTENTQLEVKILPQSLRVYREQKKNYPISREALQ